MPKVVYTSGKGLIQQGGSGLQFSELPFSPVQARTATFTVSTPGVYTMTAGAVMTGTMPLASAYPGARFVFRNGDAYANVLTASAEAAGTKAFVLGNVAAGSAQNGSKIVLQAVAGASVALVSDGANFIVMPGSGSIAFSGT
jgi:hypothetical protein